MPQALRRSFLGLSLSASGFLPTLDTPLLISAGLPQPGCGPFFLPFGLGQASLEGSHWSARAQLPTWVFPPSQFSFPSMCALISFFTFSSNVSWYLLGSHLAARLLLSTVVLLPSTLSPSFSFACSVPKSGASRTSSVIHGVQHQPFFIRP